MKYKKGFLCVYRFKHRPSPPWTAIAASIGALIIVFLLGHIFYAAINRIDTVERDYNDMLELKFRAEAADVAKSQVGLRDFSNFSLNLLNYCFVNAYSPPFL